MPLKLTTSHIEDSITVFSTYKELAERAIEQVPDAHLTAALDPESNSIATIVKHVAGNLRSRWTNFLTTDGEKPDRDRDSEFVDPPATRAELLELWESGWNCLFASLRALNDADLTRTVTIRGEPHSVLQAIDRQIAHNAMHVGQIVLLAKHYAQDHWKPLSIPRNGSEEFNRSIKAERSPK